MTLNKLWTSLYQKIFTPVLLQLKQGVNPKKLAQSLAAGFCFGCIPVLGVTTSLCLVTAAIFRLNHVAIQTANYVAYPLQFLLMIPFFRLGEIVFRVEPAPLDIKNIIQQFQDHFWEALQKYGMTGFRGFVAWLLVAPFLYLILNFVFHEILKRAMKKNSTTLS